MTDPDVAAYLNRLGVAAETPSVAALFRLHRAQLERVPYETTWIHMGERWTVDLNDSVRRIARAQRGGYCFHVNGALSVVLRALGYDVTLHVGCVYGPDGPTDDEIANHLVLLVHGLPSDENPSGTWYCDSGLGDALYEPLPLLVGSYRQNPFTFALSRSDSPVADWQFHHDPNGSFAGMAFSSLPTTIDVFESKNTELSTSPSSHFLKAVTVQRRYADGLDVLRGQVLRCINVQGATDETLEKHDWFAALNDVFFLPLHDVDDQTREVLWQRVSAAHQRWLTRPAG